LTLELRGISKTFGDEKTGNAVHVLGNIHCRVEEGRFVSIVGPSGCGKTTLLRIIAGLEKATEGEVLLDGRKIAYGKDRVGLVFQEYALFPWRTTLQNIEMGLEIMGVAKEARRAAAMEYVMTFGLEGFENRFPRELSGGMQQRVAIARTLIMNPRVILMDEPFGSLDSQTRNELQTFLLQLYLGEGLPVAEPLNGHRWWENRNQDILFVTHNVDEAVYLSDHILVLSRRPARIVNRFEVDCPRPRDRTSPECNAVRRGVLETLEEMRKGERPAPGFSA
jgi:NitT/TauT family transport system ATP-binding protein